MGVRTHRAHSLSRHSWRTSRFFVKNLFLDYFPKTKRGLLNHQCLSLPVCPCVPSNQFRNDWYTLK
jgi:hypothetical protein